MASAHHDIDRRSGLLGLALSLLAPALPASGQNAVLTWQRTVRQEHEDRRAQIQRLARDQLIAPPQLYTTLVGKADLPPDFGVDIPVLRVVFDQRVFFDTDSDAIRPEGEAAIDVIAEALRRGAPDNAVFVAGHTDSRGSDAHNYFLSVRRAESAALALGRRRVPQTQIWRIGFGKAVPLAPNTTEEGMARNRRVEFVIGRKAEAVAKALAGQRTQVCAGASAEQRARCLESLDRQPAFEAAPVLLGGLGRTLPKATPPPQPPPGTPRIDASDQVNVVPVITSRDLVQPGRPDERVSVGGGGTPPVVVPIPAEERTVVTIKPDEPVVIDMRNDRVLVERLER